jgi:alpha-L-fucosidase
MKNRIVTVVMLSLFSGAVFVQAGTFEPTRESLSCYEVPEWYEDAKIGFFYHWGPQTALGDKWDKDISDFCLQKGAYKDSNTGIKNPVGQWGKHMYPNMKNGVLLPRI